MFSFIFVSLMKMPWWCLSLCQNIPGTRLELIQHIYLVCVSSHHSCIVSFTPLLSLFLRPQASGTQSRITPLTFNRMREIGIEDSREVQLLPWEKSLWEYIE